MITVGIDKMAMSTSRYALDLCTLAKARDIDPEKFSQGLGQIKMSVPPPGEDIVTLGAEAAQKVLFDENLADIEMLLFATESGIDQSKAAALFVHELLNLPSHCRSLELKQACYSATAGMQLALAFLRLHPQKKILIIAADIARYGLKTTGESSQGAGAIALLLSAQPRLIAIEPQAGVAAESVMDFWRPNYLHEALVDGKYSSKIYLSMLEKSWRRYEEQSKRHYSDHDHFCFHTPVPRLVEKAQQYLRKINDLPPCDLSQLQNSIAYNKQIGNSYTASLYISLLSLLENNSADLSGKRVGFYSYGSGCVAEFFSGIIQPTYQNVLFADYHQQLLNKRKVLSYEQYEAFYQFKYRDDGTEQIIPEFETGSYRLSKLQQHKRIYCKIDKVEMMPSNIYQLKKKALSEPNESSEQIIRVSAPGKLILSGEHAIVYGAPALAMAIDKYVTATITRDVHAQISFDFANLSHHSRLSFGALHHLKQRIKNKYYRFIRGEFSIRDVLQKPFELAQFALGLFAETLELSVPPGVKIHVASDIPIGCGLGSSAATILSVMQAMAHYSNVPLQNEAMLKMALEAENMQHGHSSGLDLQVALQGGCLYVHADKIQKRALPVGPLYLVNTGTPQSTTGQCVEAAAQHFKNSSILDDFAAVAGSMDAALYDRSWEKMRAAIRENHQLLKKIGVVPEKVCQFIHHVELKGAAAKVCGSGSITGHNAGAVMVLAENKADIESLCQVYNYTLLPITGVARGVHAA